MCVPTDINEAHADRGEQCVRGKREIRKTCDCTPSPPERINTSNTPDDKRIRGKSSNKCTVYHYKPPPRNMQSYEFLALHLKWYL